MHIAEVEINSTSITANFSLWISLHKKCPHAQLGQLLALISEDRTGGKASKKLQYANRPQLLSFTQHLEWSTVVNLNGSIVSYNKDITGTKNFQKKQNTRYTG